MENISNHNGSALTALPYHLRLRDYLQRKHPDIWKWFNSVAALQDAGESVHLELLKTTYRLEPKDHHELYDSVEEVQKLLRLEAPVTLYQSQSGGEAGQATLYFTPGHGHVVFGGKILELLDSAELKALLGHELAHFKLWTQEESEFLVVEQLLSAVMQDARAAPSHFESARLYRLFTEIYADRGALLVAESPEVVVSTLVKTVTGLTTVNPESYLAQAEEILSKTKGHWRSESFSHPEVYIRARALALWADSPGLEAEAEIEHMIMGAWSLHNLDLTQQEKLEHLSHQILLHLLKPEWARTEAILAHAKLYFSDFEVSTSPQHESLEILASEFSQKDSKIDHYLAHLLLDFAAVDQEIQEAALALAFRAAEPLGVSLPLEKAVRKELKMKKKDVVALRDRCEKILELAAQ